MSEERKANLVIAAENQTKGTLQEIKQDAANMAQAVEQSGKKAAKGLEGIGDGGEQAAKKLDGSARSIISSIQRATATIEAGEKGTANYFETLGKQRGIGGDVLEPYLAQMRKAEAAQAASVKGLGSMEMSAKQTAAALRGVPAQFTDIFVSLQGGQAPLTVLLQQGGQLKDMFGGAGAAAKALGGYVLGLVNPFTVAAGVVGALAIAYNQGSKEQDAFVRSIVLSGNVSGVTAGQLRAYARQIDDVTGTHAKAAAGLAAFTAAGIRGSDQLRQYTQTAIEWEKATGQAVEKTAEQFAGLQKDPLNAVTKLNDGINFLTVSVYEQIQALEKQGDKVGAAQVAMDALNSAMKERSEEIEQSLGYIERGWNAVTSAASEAWDEMLGVGRKKTNLDLLKEAQEQLDVRVSRSDVLGDDENFEKGNAKLRARIQALQDLVLQEDLNASAKAFAAEQTKALIAFDAEYGDALKGQISLQDKLARARKEAEAAGKSEADITKVLAWVTEEHNKSLQKGGDSRKAAQTSYQSLLVAINESIAASESELQVGEKLTTSQKLRIKYEQELATRKRAFTDQEKANIEGGLRAAEAAERQAQAAKDLAKAWEDDAKVYDTHVKKQQALVASINSSVDKLRLEEEGHMLASVANISHSEAMERLTISRLEDAQVQMLQGAGSQEEIERIEKEIAARKALLGLMGQRAAREANQNAQKEIARDWERTAQTIGDTLADYIMSGGQDAATYLKRLFSTLVLQPVVQTVVGGVLGTGVAGASGGLSGVMSQISNSGGSLTNWSNLGGSATKLLGSLSDKLWQNGFESLSDSALQLGKTIGSVDAWLKDVPGMGGGIGSALGYGSALLSLSKGNYGSGIGQAIGTAIMPGLGTMVGGLLGGLVDGALGGFSSRGANHIGGTYSSQGLNDRQVAIALGLPVGGNKAGDLYKRSNAALDQSLAGLAGGLLGVYNGLIEQTGGNKLGINAGFAINPKYDDEESYGYFRIIDEVTGKVLAKYDNRDLSSNHDKAWQQYSSAMAGAFVGQLKQADIPGWMRDVLDGLGGAITTEGFAQAAQQIALMDSAFKSWAVNVDGFDDLAASVQTTLVRTAGGFDALAASVEGYYQNFYTEQERAAKSASQMSEVLAEYGVELPATTEQYRALVEQQLAAGDAGAELAAVLLGMQGSFKSAADVWQKELADLASSVGSFFGDLQSAIDSLSADVAADRKAILRGSDVMSAADIAAGIAGALVAAPSASGVDGAAAASLAAGAAAADAQSAHDTAQEALAQAQQKRDAATAERDAVASQIAAAQGRIAYHQWDSSRIWGDGEKSGHSLSKRKRWQRDIDAAIAKEQALIASLQPKLDPLNQAAGEQQDAYDALAETAKAAAQRLAEAQKALADAQKAQEQARVDYAKEMSQFVADAAGSVDKLSDLRGEVVNFYEAQAQAVQAMLQSAGNLRGVVDQLRLGQLNTAQTAAELGSRYATDYAMALATTGSTRAGYVDAMASNLAGLSEALKAEAATGEDWRIETAKLFAQASNAAGLLEGDAESDDYQDVALGLLDSIDAALANLSGVTQSAEDLLVKAIKEGNASNLDGLRAIVAVLQGEAIPAFAAGGLHAGGLRLVGERGPELEVTGPARYWSAGQTAALMGGGSNDAVARELRELREEQRAQASKIVQLQQENNRLLMRWETQGLPEKREVIA